MGLGSHSTLGSAVQTADKPSSDVDGMVGPEVQVPFCVGGLPVDRHIQGAVHLPPEVFVEEGRDTSFSSSKVNWIDGQILLKCSSSTSAVPFLTMQHM